MSAQLLALPLLKLVGAQIMVAAGTAVMETGVQITNQALMEKLNEWGADTSSDSFWGKLANNFNDNLGAGVQMATMQLSMGLTQSLVDPLEDSFNSQLTGMRNSVTSGVTKAKNKVAQSKIKNTWKERYIKTTDSYQNKVKNTTSVVHAGAQFGGSYSQGASGMEQAYNSKNLENLNLQGMDPAQLVQIVNQLLVAQKVG